MEVIDFHYKINTSYAENQGGVKSVFHSVVLCASSVQLCVTNCFFLSKN